MGHQTAKQHWVNVAALLGLGLNLDNNSISLWVLSTCAIVAVTTIEDFLDKDWELLLVTVTLSLEVANLRWVSTILEGMWVCLRANAKVWRLDVESCSTLSGVSQDARGESSGSSLPRPSSALCTSRKADEVQLGGLSCCTLLKSGLNWSGLGTGDEESKVNGDLRELHFGFNVLGFVVSQRLRNGLSVVMRVREDIAIVGKIVVIVVMMLSYCGGEGGIYTSDFRFS